MRLRGGRNATLARHARTVGTRPSLMLLVGETKEIAPAKFGQKLIIKHAPDCAFLLRADIAQRLAKRFSPVLELWAAMDDLHLMVFGTFSVNQLGVPSMEELTAMLVNEQWIPIDGPHDKALVDHLIRDRRHFDKGMRYNLGTDQPVASADLCDTDAPVAMCLIAPQASAPYRQALEVLQACDRVMDLELRARSDTGAAGTSPIRKFGRAPYMRGHRNPIDSAASKALRKARSARR